MTVDFRAISGDTRFLDVTISDEAGLPVDVSAATAIIFRLLSLEGETIIEKTLGAGVTVAGAVVSVELEPTDTAPLAGSYRVEMQITDGAGHVYTPLQGHATVVRDYIL